jgi:hypothetical protein
VSSAVPARYRIISLPMPRPRASGRTKRSSR